MDEVPGKFLIVPEPKKFRQQSGFLTWDRAKFSHDKEGMPTGENLVCVFPYSGYANERYSLSIGDFGISIFAGSKAAAKLAYQTLRQIGIQSSKLGLPYLEIEDHPDLEVRGFMLDISRCKVPNMQTLAYLVDMLALFKYNRLELYTEHTYAFAGHELVWADASPMTAQEYKALEEICAVAGIELVANFNSLGHMERWLRYPEYQRLAESKAPFIDPLGGVRKFPTTLYPDDAAIDFLDSLYAQFLPNFSSDKFNVGCDEPWELGMGRSKERAGREGKYQIYLEHILKLNALCRKYGKKMYFWADVLMQKPEYAKELAPDMTPVIWGYDFDHPFEKQCAYLKNLGLKFLVAPGAGTWNSFGLRLENMLENVENACVNAKRFGAEGMLLTNWGDGGTHQPFCGMYPAIVSAASAAWSSKTRLSEDELAHALSAFVFRDPSQNTARSLLEIGKIDPEKRLFCYYQRIFFADDSKIGEWLNHPHFSSLGAMEETWKKAVALLAQSKPACADSQIVLGELKLALDMIAYSLNRAKNDPHLKGENSRKNLKIIAAGFAQVWLARARLGGMGESLQRIKDIIPDIFEI